MIRCEWVPIDNESYIKYHDEEWGVEVHDDKTKGQELETEYLHICKN